MLHYHVKPYAPERHLWRVRLSFVRESGGSFSLRLPDWVPGSYMIRDFARHIVSIGVSCNGKAVPAVQTDKSAWSCPGGAGEWAVVYDVYAFDVSVRGAFLDSDRGFFDGACLFLRPEDMESLPCRLYLEDVPPAWDVATAMPAAADSGAYVYEAPDYRTFIDYPVETGRLLRLPFEAGGIAHEIVVSGTFAAFDHDRLTVDVQKICETAQRLFGRVPFAHYTFLLFVGDRIYGGLEHINSTALMADRFALPRADNAGSDAYVTLLGLFSHEYFHAWNVKSVKPQAFAESRLDKEAYTRLLWAFEGITSYYDDVLLVRSGVLPARQYLDLLAKSITAVAAGAGRLVQSLADSSFTAWTKFYKQNENSTNAVVSYYRKGALAALCLDMQIRRQTQGSKSLDDVMRALYAHWQRERRGLAEDEWLQIAEAAVGINLQDFQAQCIDSPGELPVAEALHEAGIDTVFRPLPRTHGGNYDDQAGSLPVVAAADLGASFSPEAPGIVLKQVFAGGSAERAGLSAGDRVLALDSVVITDFYALWNTLETGRQVTVHFIRDGILRTGSMTVQPVNVETALLRVADERKMLAWLRPDDERAAGWRG